jgi:hypothetical protein
VESGEYEEVSSELRDDEPRLKRLYAKLSPIFGKVCDLVNARNF